MTYPSLNFTLGETIDVLRDQVHGSVTAESQPRAAQIGQDNRFPMDMWRKFGETGLLGIIVDEEHGGSALGYLTHVAVMEEISRASVSAVLSYGAHFNLCVNQIKHNGNAERKARYLPALVPGEHTNTLAIGEPNAGPDVASMKLHADRTDDRFVLNGSKIWIVNGPDARTYAIYTRTDADKGAHGITAFIVERDWKDFGHRPKLNRLDMRGSNTCELIFQDVEVPEGNVLGAVNGGVKVLMNGLDYEHVVLSGGPVGIMQACIDMVVPYIHDRHQFGQSIGEFRLVQGKVANMYTVLNVSRAYLYAVAAACDRDETTHKDAAGVILYSAERATQMTPNAIQVLGDNGYINEFPTDRLLRGTRLYEIGAGTSEICRMLIGRELLNEAH